MTKYAPYQITALLQEEHNRMVYQVKHIAQQPTPLFAGINVSAITAARFSIVCIFLLLTGCASFPKYSLSPVGNLPPPPENSNKPTVGYSFSAGAQNSLMTLEHSENVRINWEQEFVDVLNKSGYFASISPGGTGEINIQIRLLVNSGSLAGAIPAVITGFSLYTIPSWVTENYNVTAKVTTQDGKEHIYELTDAMMTVQWLPMVFVFPLQNMVTVSKQVRQNIWKNLILKMQKDGVLARRTI